MNTPSQQHQPVPQTSDQLAALFESYVWNWFGEAFGQPTPPQAASWPKIAQGQNTLIFSPTGSGKTLAAFLWCINDLFQMASRAALEDTVYVLYVSPLKALNNDIQKNLIRPLRGIRQYAQRAGIDLPPVRSRVRTGDTTPRQRAAMARRPPHILITTPESLYIILTTAKFRDAFRGVKYVIVDEIHALSDNKRGVHLSLSLERLQHLVHSSGGREFVRIGLSATQRPLQDIARFLSGMDGLGQPRRCQIVDVSGRKDLDVRVICPVDDLLEAHFDAIWGSSYHKMLSLIREHQTTLIFANSRYKTERTALRLNELSAERPVAVGAHHGSMSKEVRLEMEDRLKRNELDALVATASLELGIDVGSIDLVCQIQSPKSVSTGVQRIGRAGHLLHATSKGRLLVTDRDDLVESAVLVKAIVDGQIDTTRIPVGCLDVLAQQIVGAVAADAWPADDLFELCRRSFCYRDLERADYDRVLDMLAGNYRFDVQYPPYPKIMWDKVNDVLYPERSARLIAFRSGGTIPDVADYDVYFAARETRVGRLDEGFVEKLHSGDIFILGSSSWRVLRIERNRVIVQDVYGQAPTIPFWGGERGSRTFDLGLLVGRFRRETSRRLEQGDITEWLEAEYHVDQNAARAISEYLREQSLVTAELPSDQLLLVEHFRDELGLQQIVVHSCFGIRVNEPWAMALREAIEGTYGFRPQTATTDDGILLTIPRGQQIPVDEACPLDLVSCENVDELIRNAVLASPIFVSRFRHNAVRSLMVLREYRGRRTPVWLQSLRASGLLEVCADDHHFPLVKETLRECLNEALDLPNLRQVLQRLAAGAMTVKTVAAKIPSPFTHSLLLLGQYGDMGAVPTRERRSRLMHLHREVLRQILDQETLRNLLDEGAVARVESRAQYTDPRRRARNANELSRVLAELGDLVDVPDEEMSILDRVQGDARGMLSELSSSRRAVLVSITAAESSDQRWIATESFGLYRAAFATRAALGAVDREILHLLAEGAPASISEIVDRSGLSQDAVERHLDRLFKAYQVLRLPAWGDDMVPCRQGPDGLLHVAASRWIPDHLLRDQPSRTDAQVALVRSFLRTHGPVTKYEVMERYALPAQVVENALEALRREGAVTVGEYVPTKSFPQWCYRSNLEQIHRLTLRHLQREMEPATAEEYAEFLMRWQHVHPDTQLAGLQGLRDVLGQLQGQENYQIVYERDVFPSRVQDYAPAMLDRLCYGGEVFWRRFDHRTLRRGYIGFCFRQDRDWIVTHPQQAEMDLTGWDDDIPQACRAVRAYLGQRGACFFDDVVEGTRLDWRLVLRALWHLVWTGEATNDSYESIRHADIASGLSACYDLGTKPGRKGVTLDFIVRHMLELRKLDPRLGRWAPTERLMPTSSSPLEPDKVALHWAHLLLRRYGIVTREAYRREAVPVDWRQVRRALVRLELLGEVRRGFFVEELSGEQYATPEAVDALRDAKLRLADLNGDEMSRVEALSPAQLGEPMVVLNVCDPANPFGALFSARNEVGEEVKFLRIPQKLLVIQSGRPILLYEDGVKVLVDLDRERAETAVRALMHLVDRPAPVAACAELQIRDWNGHPIDVSPARYLLLKLGFVLDSDRRKGALYDGIRRPESETVAQAAERIPAVFGHQGKEQAPVRYDAGWIVSRSHVAIRSKVRELLTFLQRTLPPECDFDYGPRQLVVRYRGFRCVTPYVQQRQVYLQITHKGWTRGIQVKPETALDEPEFVHRFREQFDKTRVAIDNLLDAARE